MASNGEPQNKENTTVRFNTGADPEGVLVSVTSPARNRYKGTTVGHKKGREWPSLFERASGSWWNPKFDSEVLEDEQNKSYFPQTRRQFQLALIYIILACIAWCIFFGVSKQSNWTYFLGGTLVLLVVVALLLGLTFTKFFERFYLQIAVFISIVFCAGLLVQFSHHNSDLSSVGTFSASVGVMLLMYTVIPLPLYLSVLIGGMYSIVYEVLHVIHDVRMQDPVYIVGKIMLHLCIHLMGIHIFIMAQVRRHSTFWKIGQSVMARRDLQIEKQIKEKMIHSLMPPSVAAKAMSSRQEKDDQDETNKTKKRSTKKSKHDKGEIIFRAFNMNRMDNVSILFADIVGFTKMSSNKTAEHLVSLLNDLFGRFDSLCAESGCEKISTLGDCYYCVSGCPEPREDHAKCCVEMGLGMIKAIYEFDEENKEEVNMRVGVHTGTVLCGIVGKVRFKFDVWSNDVTLANNMESTGLPGRVHISAVTHAFLTDDYEMEPGPDVQDNRTFKVLIEHYDSVTSSFAVKHKEEEKVMKTYFIVDRKRSNDSLAATPETDRKANQSNTLTVDSTAETSGEVSIEIDGHVNRDWEHADKEKEDVDDRAEISENQLSNHHGSKTKDANGVSPAALLGRRHSSTFYTTSELSLDHVTPDGDSKDPSLVPINETWTKMREMREQSDLQIIRGIKEDIVNKEYFYKPPINTCTLTFLKSDLEETYRDHYLDEVHTHNTFSSPRYHALLEIIVSTFVFTIIAGCCFVIFKRELPYLVVFFVCLLIEILIVIHTATDVTCRDSKMQKCGSFTRFVSGWYFRNIMGAIIASIPILAVYSNFSCFSFAETVWRDHFFCYCVVVTILHYCNFTMLSSWLKSLLAMIWVCLLLALLVVKVCAQPDVDSTTPFQVTVVPTSGTFANLSQNISYQSDSVLLNRALFSGEDVWLQYEIILDLILLLVLIFFLNREFEVSYRLSYHGDAQAAIDKQQMQDNKEQADWLLHNIIPSHISEQLKKTSKYSKNHKDVGVIFAALVNFNEFYDESYEGGKEYLRVLNELFNDTEELLTLAEFKDVEKIKTITSTFMGASGLNELSRAGNKNPLSHLYAMMDFALDMQQVIRRFNESIFNFEFILNIGYNFGEVTAGVIGTTKLLYDIWGDTVNIASRMYSTGVANRIQVPEATVELLKDKFEFDYRGTIHVKGKGEMSTYLVVKKKDGACWD